MQTPARIVTIGLLLLLAAAVQTAAPTPAGAAAFSVTASGDSGTGTLRAAVEAAAALDEDSTITIQPGLGTITLTDPVQFNRVARHLTIEGNGATISGGGTSPILLSATIDTSVTFNDLTLRDGFSSGNAGAISMGPNSTARFTGVTLIDNHADGNGGAILGAAVIAEDSRFEANSAGGDGGAVYAADITVEDTEVVANTAVGVGGALWAVFTVDVTRTELRDNEADEGGAVYLPTNAMITTESSTFTDNRAVDGDGGAVYATQGAVALQTSTFEGNVAAAGGGAVVADNPELLNSTVTGNTALGVAGDGQGGGVKARVLAGFRYVTAVGNRAQGTNRAGAQVFSADEMRTNASAFGDPGLLPAENCAIGTPSQLTSSGHNWSDDLSCDLGHVDDHPDAGPVELAPAADNGGPTATRLPLATSGLIDAIPVADCLPAIATDQRGAGFPRPAGAGCDIGAVDVVATCAGLPVTVNVGAGELPTAGDDVIRGTGRGDVIDGLGGDDVICGSAGDDTLRGGGGADRIFGDAGDDVLNGGAANDRLHGGNGADLGRGGAGNDVAEGGNGNDRLFGDAGLDTLRGQAGADTLTGGTERDIAFGGSGNDRAFGQGGNDTLRGETGLDLLDGGTGSDNLNGGPQRDTCRGGPQRDSQAGCEVRTGFP